MKPVNWVQAIVELMAQSAYLGALVRQMTEVFRPWFDGARIKWLSVFVLGASIMVVVAAKKDLLGDAGLQFGKYAVVMNSLLVAGAAQGVNEVINIFKRLGDKA